MFMLLAPCLPHSHPMQTRQTYNVVCSYNLCFDDDNGAVFRADVSQGSMWQILHALLPNISHLETLIMCDSAFTSAHILIRLHTDTCTYTRTHTCTRELTEPRTGRTPKCACARKSGSSKYGRYQGGGYAYLNMRF